jgi:hypothetical protein
LNFTEGEEIHIYVKLAGQTGDLWVGSIKYLVLRTEWRVNDQLAQGYLFFIFKGTLRISKHYINIKNLYIN